MKPWWHNYIIALGIFCLCNNIAAFSAYAEDATPMLIPLLKSKMSYLGERQAVLARNIANANTPEYKARDLKPFNNKAVMMQQHRLKLNTTNPHHLANNVSGGHFRMMESEDNSETTISGNNVVLDEEVRKVAENNIDYQEIINIYKKWGSMMHMAAVGSRQ